MKKNLLSATALLLCILLSGCSGNKSAEQHYPDHIMYELRGAVKSVKGTVRGLGSFEPSFDLEFYSNGKLITHPYDTFWEDFATYSQITRNANGQITSYVAKRQDNDKTRVEVHYFYDEKGRIKSTDELWEDNRLITEAFEYDSAGYLTKSRYEERHLANNTLHSETYLYLNKKIDSLGNWLERESVRIVNASDYPGEASSASFTERREILYF